MNFDRGIDRIRDFALEYWVRIVVITLIWLVSGVRLQMASGVMAFVTDYETGKPISKALVRVSWPWTRQLSSIVDIAQMAAGNNSRGGADEYESLTNERGMVWGRPRVQFVWQWWNDHSWAPTIDDVLHPLYGVRDWRVMFRPPLAILLPTVIEIRMQRLSSLAREYENSGRFAIGLPDGMGLRCLKPIQWIDRNLAFYFQIPGVDVKGVWSPQLRAGTYNDFAGVQAEWDDVCNYESPNKGLIVRSLLKNIQMGKVL